MHAQAQRTPRQLSTDQPSQGHRIGRAALDLTPRSEAARALQRKATTSPASRDLRLLQQKADQRPNTTGLPDTLKAGVESLSGMSLDHVKVHYNSAQPAQLNALAYAQGSDIHVGPGQEQHLPHEAWHIVQQAQGRVKPTMQMKDGVPVNDDAGLEREADVMGVKAAAVGRLPGFPVPFRSGIERADAHPQAKPICVQAEKGPLNYLPSDLASSVQNSPAMVARPGLLSGFTVAAAHPAATPALSSPEVVQGVFDVPDTFAEIVDAQTRLQDYAETLDEGFTTVGFEHEFAQFIGDNPLKGLTHVEVAESGLKLAYTGLPFHLETDADDALELVSPPFVVDTEAGGPTPKPEDVDKIDQAIKQDLSSRVANETTLGSLASGFSSAGIDFTLKEASVAAANFTPLVDSKQLGVKKVSVTSLNQVKVKASKKGSASAKTISSQANIATDAASYDALQQLALPEGSFALFYTRLASNITARLLTLFPGPSFELRIFVREMSRQLAGLASVPSIEYMQARGTELAAGDHSANQIRNKLNGTNQQDYDTHRSLRSHVKDAGPAWLKDTLANFGLGLLTHTEWAQVRAAVPAIKAAMPTLYNGVKQADLLKPQWTVVRANLTEAKAHADNSLDALASAIAAKHWDVAAPVDGLHGPDPRPPFGTHDPQWFGARQDTYIPGANVRTPSAFSGRRLHVVEARGDHAMERIRDLRIVTAIRAGPTLTDEQVVTATRRPPNPEEPEPRAAEDRGEVAKRLARVKEIRAILANL